MPRFSICKHFSFSAAHRLTKVKAGHPCARTHGHNYLVSVEISGERDASGFVLDYGDLGRVKKYIKKNLDHKTLNDVVPDTTAEGLAWLLYRKFKPWYPGLVAVRVSETDATWAEYRS